MDFFVDAVELFFVEVLVVLFGRDAMVIGSDSVSESSSVLSSSGSSSISRSSDSSSSELVVEVFDSVFEVVDGDGVGEGGGVGAGGVEGVSSSVALMISQSLRLLVSVRDFLWMSPSVSTSSLGRQLPAVLLIQAWAV